MPRSYKGGLMEWRDYPKQSFLDVKTKVEVDGSLCCQLLRWVMWI